MMFKHKEKRRRRTLEQRRVRNFLHRSVVVRWFIALASLAGLIGLAVVGINYEPVDLTVGQISPRTIVARVDFSYLDENATRQQRDLKSRLSPNVYRLSLDTFQRHFIRIQHLLARVAQLKREGKVSDTNLKEITDIWNEGVDIPLALAEVKTLIPISDRKVFLENLKRWSSELVEKGIVGDDQFSNSETTMAWALRPETFANLKSSHAGQFLTVSQARQRLMEELMDFFHLLKATSKAMERVVTPLVAPNLQLDLVLSEKLQERDRKNVNPIYRSVTKGKVLIERGERVTVDKLVMLKEHEAQAEREFSVQSRWRQRISTLLLVVMIFGVAVLVLEFQPHSPPVSSNREYALLATIVILHFGICRLAIYAGDIFVGLSPSFIPAILPACFGSMLIGILLDRRRAHITAFVSSFLLGVVTQFSFAVVLTSLVSSLVGINLLSPLRRRARIYEAGLMAGVTAATVMVVFGFMSEVPWRVMGWQGMIAVGAGLAASFLINSLLPLFESLFKVTTDLRWLELSDLNHPLLRRMVLEAPGTYHHSLVVANLVEHACEAIGAHALQARVCSYFHDIGKLNKPEYFCENQIGDENPHNDIAPNMSALIIIAHVKDGVDMAIEYQLTRPILDTIQQHHGTSQVSYFYRLAKRKQEDAKLGSKIMHIHASDVPRVEEETYRYPGPKPKTREIGVISLADALEGASRCMVRPTPQKIESLVTEIIEERYRDGQLDDCPLSIQDLKQVMDSFSKTMLSMMHARVVYPKDETFINQSAPIASATAP